MNEEMNQQEELALKVAKAMDQMGPIQQIKFLRMICYGLGLKEAKDVIDRRLTFQRVDLVIQKVEEAASLKIVNSGYWNPDQRARYADALRRLNSR